MKQGFCRQVTGFGSKDCTAMSAKTRRIRTAQAKTVLGRFMLALLGALALTAIPFMQPASAQDYGGWELVYGPFDSGTQTFSQSVLFQAFQPGALSGGTQHFLGSSRLLLRAQNAVTGGEQNFYDAATLGMAPGSSLTGGVQNFYFTAAMTLRGNISGGVQNFYHWSWMTANAPGAITGGAQNFYTDSEMDIFSADAVENGRLSFFQRSRLIMSPATSAGIVSGMLSAYDSATLRLAANGLTRDVAVSLDDAASMRLSGDLTIGQLNGNGGVVTPETNEYLVLTIDGSTLGGSAFAGSIGDGLGQIALTKQGTGTLTLAGHSGYTGATTVLDGLLRVNGSIADSAVSVGNGATLGGIGTVGQTFIGAGGTLAAGNSIGTLAVAGPLALGAGSLVDVEVRAGGNVPGIHNDLVEVSGAASIDPAATMLVRPFSVGETGATYPFATTYAVLRAAGGVNGTFGSVTDQFAFLDASLDYDFDTVRLRLARNDVSFASVARTSNQRAAANALAAFDGTDPAKLAFDALTPAQASAALQAVTADTHANQQSVLDGTFALLGQAVSQRAHHAGGAVMSYVDAGAAYQGPVGATGSVWLAPLAGRGTIEADSTAAGAQWNAAGLSAGYERETVLGAGQAVFGLAAAYLGSQSVLVDGNARTGTAGAQVAIYGDWTQGPVSLEGLLSYGASRVSSKRDIVIGGLSQSAAAEYWASAVNGSFRAGYGFELSDAFTVRPLAGLDVALAGHSGFTEAGAGSLNASVAAAADWSVQTAFGFEVVYELPVETGSLGLVGRTVWLHELTDPSTPSNLTLAGGGSPFDIASAGGGRDRLELGAGISWSPSSAVDINLDYVGRLLGGKTEHMAQARIGVGF